jgi:hypothetical protein
VTIVRCSVNVLYFGVVDEGCVSQSIVTLLIRIVIAQYLIASHSLDRISLNHEQNHHTKFTGHSLVAKPMTLLRFVIRCISIHACIFDLRVIVRDYRFILAGPSL